MGLNYGGEFRHHFGQVTMMQAHNGFSIRTKVG
jgi:hypothetical protein